ncbi:MAG: methyl-accepting chemotaxis protein [Clostridiaceae bacterium]|nr:methyl-accepting chemotaxis protein [Clostridiaceae bacterium]
MRKNKSLKVVLFCIIFFVSIIPVITLGSMSLLNNRKNININYKDNGKLLLDTADSMIKSNIEDYKNIIDTLISESDFSDFDKLTEDMKLLASTDKSILNFYYAEDSTGNSIQSLDQELPEGYNSKLRPWYLTAINSSNINIENPYVDEVTGKYVITLSKAVKNNDSIIGVVGIDIELTELANQLSNLKYGLTGEVMITSLDGMVVSNTDINKIGGQEPVEYSVWNDIIANSNGNIKFEYNSTKYEGFYSTSEEVGWKIILKTTVTELRKSEKNQIIMTLVVMLIVIIISLFVSLKASNTLVKLFNIIIERLKKASEGEFKENIVIETSIKEFISLDESLNVMIDKIRLLMQEVSESATVVNEIADESLDNSNEIKRSIEQVGKTMEEISAGTMESANGLELIASDMNSLSSAMISMKDETYNINTMALNANELSERGIEIVKVVMDKSSETKISTQEVTKVVVEVSNSIEKIENINKTISSITEQTNLLALNAAIEAARAGEAGRGFAVVSDSIRKLAEETAVSAKQIDEIIYAINTKSKEAVEKVNLTTEAVNHQEEVVKESEEVFTEIVKSIGSLNQKVNNITLTIDNINNMKDNVVSQVENLSALLEQTAAGSEEITASVQEVNASTEKFVLGFNNLIDKSMDLKEQLSVFKF